MLVSTVLTFSAGFHLGFLFAYFVWNHDVLHHTTKGNFCNISQHVNKSDSSSKKESSWESPGRENRRQIFFFLSLALLNFLHVLQLRMNIRTSLNYRKFVFPVSRNYLSREFRSFSSGDITGGRCRVPLVGGLTAMTCEKCEFLWRTKTRGWFLCKLPLLKRIYRVYRFVGFSWKLARIQ